jgi:hypothetical protein
MKSKICLLSIALLLPTAVWNTGDVEDTQESTPGLNFNPQVIPDPNMASYNAFWDGAVGSRGYWGSLPQPDVSVFSPSFDYHGNPLVFE